MKDYLLKREAELIEASERLDALYTAAWQTGDRDIAHAYEAGQRLLLERISEVQAALRFLKGGKSK